MIIVSSVAVILYYMIIMKRGGNKKVKQAIRNLVNEKIKGGETYSAVYATDQEYITRNKMISRSYIIAFGKNDLYIMPISIDKSRIICFEIMHVKERDIVSIKFNRITGYGEIKLKDVDEVITYWIMVVAVKIGNSAIQATVVQNKEVEEYIEFVKSMQEKPN
jgi:hypothetical protein